VGHVACKIDMRYAYKVLVGVPDGRIPLERPRRRWEVNIIMDLTEMALEDVNSV